MADKDKKLKIDFLSLEGLDGKTTNEKAKMILDKIANDRIVVIDTAIPADEELNLVEMFRRLSPADQNLLLGLAQYSARRRRPPAG